MKVRRGCISKFAWSSTVLVAVFLSISLSVGNIPNLISQGNIANTNPSPLLEPTVDLDCDPDTLNLESKGNWITCYIELEAIDQYEYLIEQSDWEEPVSPVATAQDGAAFYNYYSASSHTGYEEPWVSKLMLHEDTLTGDLSLIMHHNIDFSTSGIITGYGRVDFDLDGVPAGAYVSQSDDTAHAWDPPRSQEFSLAYAGMEGHWAYGENTDGGALDGLPTDEEWSITVDPLYWENIYEWVFRSGDGVEHVLNMTLPVTISRVEVSYSVYEIDATTILLNDALPPELDEKYGFVHDPDSYIMDHDNDTILERMVSLSWSMITTLSLRGW
ncbi:MAG: hypothetical protein JSV43_08875 [Methanobacteriota archaeon]|nr:MAG: hypothetical protein JSV43_08875 [Euryarchaeota archaeon]